MTKVAPYTGWFLWMKWPSTPNGAWWPCGETFVNGFRENNVPVEYYTKGMRLHKPHGPTK